MTHAELVIIAERWLLNAKSCGFVFRELHHFGSPEIPDALGFEPGNGCEQGTILVECKASRADFLSDAKKTFRKRSEAGVGAYRFYLSPTGIIQPEDLPEKWGLVWVGKRGKAQQMVGPKGNAWSHSGGDFHFAHRNLDAEWSMMASALRRLHIREVLPLIYDRPFEKTGKDGTSVRRHRKHQRTLVLI